MLQKINSGQKKFVFRTDPQQIAVAAADNRVKSTMFGKLFSPSRSSACFSRCGRLSTLCPARILLLGVMLSIGGLASGCGNKGDLYMEVDPITRQQLDTASQQLLQQGQTAPQTTADATAAASAGETASKPKSKPKQRQQQ